MMYRTQKVLSMLIGIILIFNILVTPVFAGNSSQESNVDLQTSNQENKTDEIPFEFNSSVNKSGSTVVELMINAQNKASSIELTVGESGSKNTAFNGVVNKNHLEIENIELNKVYDFAIRFTEKNKEVKVNSKNVSKDSVTDVTERYVGTFKVVTAADGSNSVEMEGLHRITSVKPDMIEENSVDAMSTIDGSSVIETEGLQRAISAESNVIEKSSDAQEVQLLSTDGQVTQASLVTTEIEPNEPYQYGQTYTEGDDMYGKVGYSGDVDYYQVTWFQSGVANFWVGMPSDKDYELEIFNYMGAYLKGSYKSKGIDELIENYPVNAGDTFFIKVYGATSSDYSSTTQYHLRAKSYPYPDGHEKNNTFSEAKSISDGTIYANIHSPYDADYYKIYLSQDSILHLDLYDIPWNEDYDMSVYNSSYSLVASSTYSSNAPEAIHETLPSGTYYIKIHNKGYSSYHANYYALKVGQTLAPDFSKSFKSMTVTYRSEYDGILPWTQTSEFYHSVIYFKNENTAEDFGDSLTFDSIDSWQNFILPEIVGLAGKAPIAGTIAGAIVVMEGNERAAMANEITTLARNNNGQIYAITTSVYVNGILQNSPENGVMYGAWDGQTEYSTYNMTGKSYGDIIDVTYKY